MATRNMVGAKPTGVPGSISIDRFPGTIPGQSEESQNEELWWWVLATWGVKIPRQKICPDHVAPFTAFADAYYARHSSAIWKASRGFGGKTMLLSILGMSELVSIGAYATILGGSGAQSLRVHETMQEAWNYQGSPSYLLLRDPTKYDTYLTNGGHARTLMASTKSVRGPHPQRMRLDEIDEMEMKVLESAQGQPMRKKNLQGDVVETNTVMSSTHQYPNGTMTKMLKRAKDSNWPIFQWCWKETSNPIDGWLSIDEIETKRTEITAAMWSAEYDLQEPSFDGRAIDESSVDFMFDPKLGVAQAGEGKYIELEEPNDHSDYVTGVDWAKARDFTIIWTFDTTVEPWKTVAFERLNRRPWPAMIDRLNIRLARYGGKVAHDATGLGGVIDDFLVIPKGVRPRDIHAVIMAGRSRSDMITGYVSAIEQKLIRAPRLISVWEEHKFATPDDLYNGSSTSHLPDTIAAGALAWSLRSAWTRISVPVDISYSRPSSPWKI